VTDSTYYFGLSVSVVPAKAGTHEHCQIHFAQPVVMFPLARERRTLIDNQRKRPS